MRASIDSLWFAVGDYAAGAATAVLTAILVHAVVSPSWDIALAMLFGMAAGLAAHLSIMALAGPLLGMFPVMASSSLIGSYGGMLFAMRDSMQSTSWSSAALVAGALGVVVVAGVRSYDRALRGPIPRDVAREPLP